MKLFWSYSKRDDPKPFRLTKLKDQFQGVLGQCLGKDIDVFIDRTDLAWGAKWREQLEKEVKSADGFVCILTPSFFTSKTCIQEFVWARDENINIFPILYRVCPKGYFSQFSGKSDSLNPKLNSKSRSISDYQYKNFEALRNYEIDSKEVLAFLDDVCENVVHQ